AVGVIRAAETKKSIDLLARHHGAKEAIGNGIDQTVGSTCRESCGTGGNRAARIRIASLNACNRHKRELAGEIAWHSEDNQHRLRECRRAAARLIDVDLGGSCEQVGISGTSFRAFSPGAGTNMKSGLGQN